MKGLKEVVQKIENEKEDLKLKIQNIFTKIRTILNEREDELLLEADNIYKTKYFNEDIIKNVEKFPKKIKLSLEKGKLIDKEWDNNVRKNILNSLKYLND